VVSHPAAKYKVSSSRGGRILATGGIAARNWPVREGRGEGCVDGKDAE